MTEQTPDPSAAPRPQGLVARFVGIIFSPRQTFEAVAASPKWLGMLVVVVVLMAAGTYAFLSTQVGRQAMLDQQVSSMESFGMTVTDEQYAQMEQRLGMSKYFGAGSQLIVIPIVWAIMAGLLFAIFNAGMGGSATYKQVYAVVVHSGVIGVVQQLFVLPLNYARGSMSSPTNLAALLPMLPEKSFFTYFLGTIDIFMVWSVIVLAIGLAVLYKRRTQPVATTLFIIYGVIALCIAGVRTWMGGS
jgi:hypothetical protein